MKPRTFRFLGRLVLAALLLLLAGLYAIAGSYVYLEPSLPTAAAMRNVEMQVPLRVYTRDGQLIQQIGEQRRVPLAYEDIPQLVREAFLAAEDDRFFRHHGIDYTGVLRAVLVNLLSRGYTQGASTITMQAARNMFLTPKKDLRRKLSEVFVTLRMEHEFSKEQILATYLNVIFFGQRAYGVAAAAEAYFGKPLKELSVAEIATLAGLPKAPSDYNPVSNPRAAQARRHYVLQRMARLRYIDAATAAHADAEPMQAREYAPLYDIEAPYIAEMVRQEVVERYGEAAINSGYRVYTTVDGRLQAAADRALRLGLIEYDRRHGYRGPLGQARLDEAALGSTDRLEALLASVPAIGNLTPAVVVSVAPNSARVYARGAGYAQVDWDGLSWAARRVSDTRTGPPPRRAEDVVRRGDIVYVVGAAPGPVQLAQSPEAQAALVSIDPADGAVVALVGGFDYFSNKFNRAIQARRQPGSGFKPFLYSAALEHGFTPSSILMDAPIVLDDAGMEQAWRPENSGGDFSGPIRLREALVRSRNLVSIRLLRSIGPDVAIDYAARFGFEAGSMPRNLTLALGTLPATPLEVATAYATFANGGFRVKSYFIDRIENAGGEVLWHATPALACNGCETAGSAAAAATAGGATGIDAADGAAMPAGGTIPPPEATWVPPQPSQSVGTLLQQSALAPRVISAANCWLMDDMMGDVIRRGTGRRALVLGRSDLSGKTGTTNEARDTWFNGFNQNLVASVWVGFDQERPLGEGEEGARTAVPIWVTYMREALRGVPDVPRPRPAGLVQLTISARTGLPTTAGDPEAMTETFLAAHLPEGAVLPAADGTAAPLTPGGAAPRRGTDTTESGESIF
ncbi:MAG: PBP1A family penicillin-binding protein [Steroidobacteraceae bacterium]